MGAVCLPTRGAPVSLMSLECCLGRLQGAVPLGRSQVGWGGNAVVKHTAKGRQAAPGGLRHSVVSDSLRPLGL